MQSEMNEAVSEWKVSCDQEDERDEQALDVYAESIRFQFGPHPAIEDELTQPGTPYCFRAGTPDKLSFPVCRQTYSRYLPLMMKRKAGKRAVRKSLFPHGYSMIQTRRVSKCGRRRSSQFKNVGRV